MAAATRDGALGARPTVERAAGWAVALGGPIAALLVVRDLSRPSLVLALLMIAVVAVATAAAGALAGVTAAALGGALTWWLLDGRVTYEVELALAVVIGGVIVALVLAALRELRQRDRIRARWLERLAQLTEELAGLPDRGGDPVLVAEAARRAAGAAAVTVEAVDALDPIAAGESTGGTATGAALVRVPSSSPSGVVLQVRLGEVPPTSLALEHDAFLRAVADQCAAALERSALLAAERRATEDFELLAKATSALSASLDLERVASTIRDLLVPHLADECVLTVATRAGPGRPATPGDDDGTVVPLRDRGEVIGQLTLRRHHRALSPAERDTALLVAEPASRALAHALLFSEQVRTSSTLELSLLPDALLPVPDLQVATRYLPAAEGHAAGGDFYDVLRVPSGGAVLVVGDVQGKGVEAATLTSTARHTLRAGALGGASPSAMLRQLNQALLYGHAERLQASGEPTVRFVTASVVSLTPTAQGFRAVVASGGHPPPILIRPHGGVEQLVVEGPLLGVFDEPQYEELVADLALSDVLVLYTDGVTEQRQQPSVFDEAQLGRLVRNMLTARHAEAVAQVILDTVVALSPKEVRDDIALVVARVTGPR